MQCEHLGIFPSHLIFFLRHMSHAYSHNHRQPSSIVMLPFQRWSSPSRFSVSSHHSHRSRRPPQPLPSRQGTWGRTLVVVSHPGSSRQTAVTAGSWSSWAACRSPCRRRPPGHPLSLRTFLWSLGVEYLNKFSGSGGRNARQTPRMTDRRGR